ncbi:hypothetical protein INT47_002827 [Mucor saturninus]|uniref:C2H2-type domain-containing protein n=1 Tax=Mucor saturninus TaxID=64648 RepID=A0A8H7QNU9_9FUNG|nr:hypothetical protein INT47_002827 [Mucor saturninus]
MNNQGEHKPSLPSIKDLLEGGPGLLDYSKKSKIHSHRRHASEHTLSNNAYLPLQMQSLSLGKPSRERTHSRSYSDLTPRPPTIITRPSSPTTPTSPIPDEEEEEEEPGKYVCPYCDKAFTRPSSLRTHTYSHTGEKPFKCTEPACGRKFSVQSNLRRHLRIHRLNKPSTLFKSKNIK